ncbi:MAG: helix-turn-helix transcriptional regulator [Muribaculaceae bacterium]|nr:helix-turn-helix transcriptional regulator [Muribaculaceae bacterium]
MERFDIAKLRKAAGISQRELAERLGIRPSFLSAIENGRSRLPEAQLEKIKQIFKINDLTEFIISETAEVSNVIPPHTHFGEEGNAIALFLQHIHNQAHQEAGNSGRESVLEQRIDYLSERNDKLSARVDELRDKLDAVTDENYRLKLLLAANGISY